MSADTFKSDTRIAIVGIHAQIPSGYHSKNNLTHREFFDFLLQKKQSYEQIPENRFHYESRLGKGIGEISVSRGSFLKAIDEFDHAEFGISSMDARAMSPSTRKLIETSFLALMDAGIVYRNRNVGCYMSGTSIDLTNVSEFDEYDLRGSFASIPSMIANRVSHALELKGPSIPVDTACSSSLSALHLAVQALRQNDCESAVVGGCQLNQRFMDWIAYSQGSLLASDGRCKPFSAEADGFSRAEACVVVVIKPLLHALKDGDKIYATILDTAVNSVGGSAPPGAPFGPSQQEAMKTVFRKTGKNPKEIDFIELHATGTKKGDPEESNWVGNEFGGYDRSRSLLVGSVKGNIGHSEIAAFLVSLVKVLLIFEHKIIPPTVNIKTLNPNIGWEKYNMDVPREGPQPFPHTEERLGLISINSSGIGGSNGHALLEDRPIRSCETFHSYSLLETSAATAGPSYFIFVTGGLSPRSASRAINDIKPLLLQSDPVSPGPMAPKRTIDYATLSTVLARRARGFTWRSFATLKNSPEGMEVTQFSVPQNIAKKPGPVVFVFSGQGPQHILMGKNLYRNFFVFRKSIDELDEIFCSLTGKSIIHDYGLFGDFAPCAHMPDTWPIFLILPSIAMFQMALYDLLISLGIRPNVVVGHSAGETAVMYASGAASKSMAMEIAIIRGQVFSRIEKNGGSMAALSCSSEVAENLIAESRKLLSSQPTYSVAEVACYNAFDAVAISGDKASVAQIIELAQKQGIWGKMIKTTVPVHSSMMEACRDEYCSLLADLFNHKYPGEHRPSIPTYSTLTGKKFGPVDTYSADYFWRNTREAVRFSEAISTINAEYHTPGATFIEISPHPVLSSYISSIAGGPSRVLSTIYRPKQDDNFTEYLAILELCGHLTVSGYDFIKFDALNNRQYYVEGVSSISASLPPYPFMPKIFPLYPSTPGSTKQFTERNGPLNHPYLRVNKDTHPSLAEHIIRGEPIMPAAGFIEMALEFGAPILINIKMTSIFSLSSDDPVDIEVKLDGLKWTVKSRPLLKGSYSNRLERTHAEGYISHEYPALVDDLDIPAIRERCKTLISSELYPSLEYFSAYGTRFRRVNAVYLGDSEALASLRGLDEGLSKDGNYIAHPAILDACIHLAGYRPFHGDYDPNAYYLPAEVGSFILHQKLQPLYFPAHMYAHVRMISWQPGGLVFDVLVSDQAGKRIATFNKLKMEKHRLNPPPELASPFDIVLHEPFPNNCASNSDNQEDSNLANHDNHLPFSRRSALLHINYVIGREMDLQYQVNKLDSQEELELWIFAEHGRNGGAAFGLVRCLRREYPLWTIRLVVSPYRTHDEIPSHVFRQFTTDVENEHDFVILPSGVLALPRIQAIPPLATASLLQRYPPAPQLGYIGVHILSRSTKTSHAGFFGVVADPNDTDLSKGLLVIGLSPDPIDQSSTISLDRCFVDATSSSRLPHFSPNDIMGFIVAVLAPGPSLFARLPKLRSQKILITNADSPVGASILRLYSFVSVQVRSVDSSVSLLDLSFLGSYDIVISGYEDKCHAQIVQSLVKDNSGRVFFWGNQLAETFANNPCLIGDCMQVCASVITQGLPPAELPSSQPNYQFEGHLEHGFPLSTPSHFALYSPAKTYIIIGGIGSIGAQLALYLYKHGARRIVLTSRSGKKALQKRSNLMIKHIVAHLSIYNDLDLTLEAVDGSSHEDMGRLLGSCGQVGGCIILSAIVMDGLFPNMTEDDYAHNMKAKTGVLDTLADTLDISKLDFLVAFSSVAGTFGTGGQTSYGASNTALEECVAQFPNAFSFVCPGILDSTLILSNDASLSKTRFSHLIEWSLSMEDMMIWFNDAMDRFHAGQRFHRYMPNLDWEALDRTHGMTPIGRHLLTNKEKHEFSTVSDTDTIQDKINTTVKGALKINDADLALERPLTSYGMDSLSASRISYLLRPFVQVSQIQLLADLCLLDLHTLALRLTEEQKSDFTIMEKPEGRADIMKSVLQRYIHRMESLNSELSRSLEPPQPYTSSEVFLLTGSTGSLGCNTLAKLLKRGNVSRIYVLGRSSGVLSLKNRQQAAFAAHGLPEDLIASPKLVFVEGDLSMRGLGIRDDLMPELLTSLTHIIHNAWMITFTSSLEKYQDLLDGTLNLLELAAKSDHRASVAYISTIGVYHNVDHRINHLESPVMDPEVSVSTGYLESKWISERMVTIAADIFSIRTSIIRTGLLTGSISGFWDTSHWLPSLIQSGTYLGCLPGGNTMVSWIPVNIAAAAIVDYQDSLGEILHIIHPKPVEWSVIIEPVAKYFGVPIVPYAEWYARLNSEASLDAALESSSGKKAALALLGFFQEALAVSSKDGMNECFGLLPSVTAEKGIQGSKTLSDHGLSPLGRSDVERWMTYWRSIQFIP